MHGSKGLCMIVWGMEEFEELNGLGLIGLMGTCNLDTIMVT